MPMNITGCFPEGIIVDGIVHCDFTLSEQTFRTTLEVAHDPLIENDKLSEEVYYSAALMSKRLQVDGLDRVTPEQVLDLCTLDSAELINKTTQLETQRANFRSAAQAAAKKRDSTSEDGAD